MVNHKVVITNPTGLHLRAAGVLCTEAVKFQSKITFSRDTTTANAKSVLSVLGAGVKCGDELEFVCEGVDEDQALCAMLTVINNGLGE
ncbi:MAG: HPr family phosphocarrier protein [Lachnospiraceae bacterium]|nr:HPr family phosphocarrier protein [Lachnospiraceae bacterium]